MVGRTNALVRALVSSVNEMTGVVVLNANIAYNTEENYETGTIGAALNGEIAITQEAIDALYGTEDEPPSPPEEDIDDDPVEETSEESMDEPTENNEQEEQEE